MVNPSIEQESLTPVKPLNDATISRIAIPRQDATVFWNAVGPLIGERVCQWLANDGRLTSEQIEIVRQAIDSTANLTEKDSQFSDAIRFSDEESDSIELATFEGQKGSLSIGHHVGNYEVVDTLGRGGTGLVYEVRHVKTDQRLALKVLNQSNASARFQREMDLVCRLAHPNIVFAHEVGQSGGLWFIAMEKLCGPDVRKWVIDGGPLNWETTVPIIYQISGALQQAHARRLVHRDVKPGNLICADDGVIKLADLGLAAMMTPEDREEAAADESFHTRVEALGGTPGYMAPEQAHSLAAADSRSDIYSLGATWFYMLTGESMVPGKTWSERLSELIRGDHIRTLTDEILPEPFLSLWRSMVARDPMDRPQSVAEISKAMEANWDRNDLGGVERSINILVVEDDQDDLFITLQSLRRFNTSVDVQSAQSLDEGIRIASGELIEVVLLDLQLPDASGLETVSKFRKACPNVIIIVLSGQDDEGIDQACRLRGADDFVAKHSIGVPELERIIFIAMARKK